MTHSLPNRKRPAHHPPIVTPNRPIVIFVTVNVKNQSVRLNNEQMHTALTQAWQDARQWRVGDYLIMPDHVHLFCIPGVHYPENIAKWVQYWKGHVRRILKLKESIWQRDCWDTQIRNINHYNEKLSYMRENPVRRELVARNEDWPYQGKINIIRW